MRELVVAAAIVLVILVITLTVVAIAYEEERRETLFEVEPVLIDREPADVVSRIIVPFNAP
ncbi:MAG TPA: hypothetical protein VNA04_04660 [Thermoanaerobaculia bacterium]|nr:hypothetical protein [Thermoanaerobaculia bacterium]